MSYNKQLNKNTYIFIIILHFDSFTNVKLPASVGLGFPPCMDNVTFPPMCNVFLTLSQEVHHLGNNETMK